MSEKKHIGEIKVGDCFRVFDDEVFLVTGLKKGFVVGIAVTPDKVEVRDAWAAKRLSEQERIDRAEFEAAFAAIRDEVQEALKTK